MKIFFPLLVAVLIGWMPIPARADHHFVFIHSVVKLSSTSCAVELEISADNQDNFMPEDRIEVDDVELARMEGAAAVINAGGNTNDGNVILFASPGFETQTGLTADVSIPDNGCGSLLANVVVAFVLDDINFGGMHTEIDTLTTDPAFGGDNTAMANFTAGAIPQFLDLDIDTLTVSNNAGDVQTVGGGGGGGGGNGGCSLSSGSVSTSPLGYLLMLGLGLAAGALRVRRS